MKCGHYAVRPVSRNENAAERQCSRLSEASRPRRARLVWAKGRSGKKGRSAAKRATPALAEDEADRPCSGNCDGSTGAPAEDGTARCRIAWLACTGGDCSPLTMHCKLEAFGFLGATLVDTDLSATQAIPACRSCRGGLVRAPVGLRIQRERRAAGGTSQQWLA